MGRLPLYSLLAVVVLFLSLSPVAYSDTFIDTFDDPVFTNNNWVTADEEIQQVWTFPTINGTNLGYHASTTSISPPAAKIAHYGVPYYTSGLSIETLIRINFTSNAYSSESYAGVGFAISQENRCIISLQLDFDGPTEIKLQIHFDGDDIDEIPVSINFDTFYKLVVQVDSNKDISAYLYELDDTLLGSVFANNILSIDSGAVGIFGTPEVTFDDFKLIGNPVGQTSALSRTQISQLYVSIFNRASEGEGNAYWRSQPDMATAAAAMLDTQAAKDYFGANLNTNRAFIEHIYLNTLNKTIADDPDGIAYWVGLLNAGTSRGEAVSSLVGVIRDYAPGGPYYNPGDVATVAAYKQFTNRVTVSDYMADTVEGLPDNWETATKFEASGLEVTNDTATVTAAKSLINHMGDNNPAFGKIPDTGQTRSYTTTFGEDSDYTINPPSYTKLDSNGNDLPDSATIWVMVRDNVTGLIWENKTDDGGIHDKDNTYTWYDPNPETNGGNSGKAGNGTDTKDFIDGLNDTKFGGFNDWRLPTIFELSLIVHADKSYPGPTINSTYFQNTVSSGYLSSNTLPGDPDRVGCVYFHYGDVYYDYRGKSYNYHVRGVRGETKKSKLIDNMDGTVTDTKTGLMWQQEEPGEMDWEEALVYCENLQLSGYSDWRLPSRNELQSIIDYTCWNPAVTNSDLFPGIAWSEYWSSTAVYYFPDSSWSVSFHSGAVQYGPFKSNNCYVRAVRGGQ